MSKKEVSRVLKMPMKLSQLNTEADANISASPSEELRRRHLSSAESNNLSVERTGEGLPGKSSLSANSGGPTNISAYLQAHRYNKDAGHSNLS